MSTLLNIREMQIKTTKNHHIPVRMAIVERFTNNKCWREYGGKGTFLHCWWGKLVQPLGKIAWMFLRKLKIELPDDPAIPLLNIYLDNTIIQKHICTTTFNTVNTTL